MSPVERRRIRVVHFADNVNRWDPIDNIVSRLDTARFDVAVIRLVGAANIAPLAERSDRPIFTLSWTGPHHYLDGARALIAALEPLRPDIVHTHHFSPALLAGVAKIRYSPAWRFVMSRHYADLVDYAPSLKGKLFAHAAEELVHRAADRIIAISSSVDEALGNRARIRKKVVRIPSGFDAEKYEPALHSDPGAIRHDLGTGADEIVIGAFGRQDAPKAFDLLLEAVAELHGAGVRARLWMVGEGPEHEGLVAKCRALGLEHVVDFLGWRLDAMLLMASVDIVCHPSRSEAYSQVGAEAMFLGKPLVMTTAVGNRDTIVSGVNGFLVTPGNTSSLHAALDALCGSSELRTRVGAAARETALARLGFRERLPAIESLYESLLQPSSIRKP